MVVVRLTSFVELPEEEEEELEDVLELLATELVCVELAELVVEAAEAAIALLIYNLLSSVSVNLRVKIEEKGRSAPNNIALRPILSMRPLPSSRSFKQRSRIGSKIAAVPLPLVSLNRFQKLGEQVRRVRARARRT